jgi:hypothetical protein
LATKTKKYLLQCHKVTEEVEALLGKVTYTQPTSERFEEKVTITAQEVQKVRAA